MLAFIYSSSVTDHYNRPKFHHNLHFKIQSDYTPEDLEEELVKSAAILGEKRLEFLCIRCRVVGC